MRCARAAAALLVLAGACAHGPDARPLPDGRVAARFVADGGAPVTLAAFRGQVLLVTVLTTWNDFALLEVPLFEELRQAHAPDFEVLCVVLDEDPKMREIFRETFGVSFPVVAPHDPPRFTSEAGPFGPIGILPTSVLLDREGRIVARNDGLWTPAVLREAVERLVREEDGR